MNNPFKFELSIIGLGNFGLPLGLQLEKSGVRLFEDHAVADQKVATAGLGFPHGMPTKRRSGEGKIGFEFANASSNDQGRQRVA